jgi:hypothetical protein
MQHGDQAAVAPAGWRVDQDDQAQSRAVCPHCAALADAAH